MAGKRKQHSAAFKAQVALAALKGDKTVNELAGQFAVHPTLIHTWKKQMLAGADQVFHSGARSAVQFAEVTGGGRRGHMADHTRSDQGAGFGSGRTDDPALAEPGGKLRLLDHRVLQRERHDHAGDRRDDQEPAQGRVQAAPEALHVAVR